jgi:hypothetical protein
MNWISWLSCYHSCPGYHPHHEMNFMAQLLPRLSGISSSPWIELHGSNVTTPVRDIFFTMNWTSWFNCYHACPGYQPWIELHVSAVITPVRDIVLNMNWTSWLSCYYAYPGYFSRHELNFMVQMLSLLSEISISPQVFIFMFNFLL